MESAVMVVCQWPQLGYGAGKPLSGLFFSGLRDRNFQVQNAPYLRAGFLKYKIMFYESQQLPESLLIRQGAMAARRFPTGKSIMSECCTGCRWSVEPMPVCGAVKTPRKPDCEIVKKALSQALAWTVF